MSRRSLTPDPISWRLLLVVGRIARRPRLFAPGLLYDVIVRGNQRQKTFLNDQDYRAYLERLAKYRERYGYSVHAYCLMSNHVHLLLVTGCRGDGSKPLGGLRRRKFFCPGGAKLVEFRQGYLAFFRNLSYAHGANEKAVDSTDQE